MDIDTLTVAQVEKELQKEEERLLGEGFTREDLQLLRDVVESMAYPIIKHHFKKLYEHIE